ncbi:WhiB family transcriptional regulator [Aeromicrobium marinum]|nr:WhiB family transcriptional regulator [Aeromicrobium marinum]
MTIVIDTVLPPCADDPTTFLDEYLQAPPPRSALTAADRRLVEAKRATAHRQCAGCPVFVDCLYRAVVEVDVAGYVACTTEAERRSIRRDLGIRVHDADDTAYGARRVGGGPVSHEVVLTVRHAYPKDTCQQLAERLGCSTSTVKRHLRKAREDVLVGGSEPDEHSDRPTIDAVLDAFDELSSSRVA